MLQLARSEDREAVNSLALQVHAMHVSWRPDLYEMAEALYPEERFETAVKNRQIYVAKINNAVVGYVLLQIRNHDMLGNVKRRIMQVEEICVQTACRNQGIGKQMMEDVNALARAFHCSDLQLSVYPQNDEAVGFYQKCGFTIRSIDMQRKV